MTSTRTTALRRWTLIALLSLSLLSALAWGAWRWLHAEAASRLASEASARGLSVTWEELRLTGAPGLTLRGVSLGDRSGALEATLDTLEVTWGWEALRAGREMPASVRLEGLEARVDAAQPGPLEGGAATSANTSGSHRTLPEVALEGGRIEVRGLPGPVSGAKVEGLTLRGRGTPEGWTLTGQGRCVQGCGERAALSFELRREAEADRASVSVDPPLAVVVPVPGMEKPAELRVGRAVVRRRQGALEVWAEEVQTALEWRGRTISLEVAQVHPSGPLSKPSGVRLEGPRAVVGAPGAQLPDEEPDAATAPKRWQRWLEEPEALARIDALSERLIEALARIEVHGGRLEVGGATFTGVEVTPGDGRVAVSLGLGEGRVSTVLTSGQEGREVTFEGLAVDDVARLPGVTLPGWLRGGRVGGRLSLRREVALAPEALRGWKRLPERATSHAEGLRLEGRVRLDGVAVAWEAVAPGPMVVEGAEVSFGAGCAPSRSRRVVDRCALEAEARLTPRRGQGPVLVRASVEARSLLSDRAPQVVAQLEVSEVDCDAAFQALPRGLMPHLEGELRARGRFGPRLGFQVDMADPETFDFDLEGLPGSCEVTSLGRFDPGWLNEDFVREVTEGVSREGIEVGPGTEGFVRLSKLPTYVGAAAYLSEEAAFYRNRGFGLGLIKRAIRMNLEGGRYVYGGSSVSQQLVKNLFLTRDKTLSRKLEEAIIVWEMESKVSKDRILELYLNCIEFGPDLYGIGPASWHYFGKPAWRLQPLEASFLAAIKPAPWYGERFQKAGRTPSQGWWRERLEYIMTRLHEKGFIGQEALDEAAPYVLSLPRRRR